MLLNPFFGKFGGQFVPELLIPALDQLEKAFVETKDANNAGRKRVDPKLTICEKAPAPLQLVFSATP